MSIRTQIINFIVQGYGSLFIGLSFLILYICFKRKNFKSTNLYINLNTIFILTLLFIVSTVYLYYPNFIDGSENSHSLNAINIESGFDLYPYPSAYPFNGALYGPLFPNILNLSFRTIGINLFAAKLPTFIALIFSIILFLKIPISYFERRYIVFLAPFGALIFIVRPDVVLLLLTLVAIYVSTQNLSPNFKLIFLGSLAGIAGNLKITGILYIFAIVLLCKTFSKHYLKNFFIFSSTFIICFTGYLVYSKTNFIHYFEYILGGTNHGYSIDLFIYSFIAVLTLNIPILLNAKFIAKRELVFIIFPLFIIELFICSISSKAGSAPGHLIPIVAISAYANHKYSNLEVLNRFFTLVVLSVLIVVFGQSHSYLSNFSDKWVDFSKSQNEMRTLNKQYKGLTFLPTSNSQGFNKPSFLIASKTKPQLDIGGYTDTLKSKISFNYSSFDLHDCSLGTVIVESGGDILSIKNAYNSNLNLFSPTLENSFASSYNIDKKYRYFTVYRCVNKDIFK